MAECFKTIMKLNLLIDTNESTNKGPGKRALNLRIGLDKLGIDYDICSSNFGFAFGMQIKLVDRYFHQLKKVTPIGPNVIHDFSDHLDISVKFQNFVVQSQWVKDYMFWHDKDIAKEKTFFEYPASVDIDSWKPIYSKVIKYNCLFYTKYQSDENKEFALQIPKSRNHSVRIVEYGTYTNQDLRSVCYQSEYCIFNSCCEKSSNALLEILATNTPVYIVDSNRWIGDDKFDKATSAPHFSDECGVIDNFNGEDFDLFYEKVKMNHYHPLSFTKDFNVDVIAQKVIDILEECYS